MLAISEGEGLMFVEPLRIESLNFDLARGDYGEAAVDGLFPRGVQQGLEIP